MTTRIRNQIFNLSEATGGTVGTKAIVSSAQVTNALPTKVVITFNKALDEDYTPATSAFTLAGKTISGVAVSGVTVTLTVTVAYAYGDSITVSYTKPGSNALEGLTGGQVSAFTDQAVANNVLKTYLQVLNDGNTTAWYASDDAATITKDGSDLVSTWADKLASGRNLTNVGATNTKPVWSSDGILFDGSNDIMTASFTLVQPEAIYMVCNVKRAQQYDMVLDGAGYQTGAIGQMVSGTLSCVCTFSVGGAAFTENTWHIVRVFITSNANGGKFILDNGAPYSWDATPVGNLGGLTMGASGAGVYNSNVQVKELIVRKVSDVSADETLLYNYLKAKHGL